MVCDGDNARFVGIQIWTHLRSALPMKNTEMKLLLSAILLLGFFLTSAQAQVRHIELDIAGYLCGF